jgi:hypothetical protein
VATYGVFAGRIREIAPIPAAGATDAPTVEVLCDDPLAWMSRRPARLADSLTRSQLDFRIATLDAIGESAGRRDLAMESATLPISSADAPNALQLLSDLNSANGTRHFVRPAADKAEWYRYTTRNRQYKLGAAADVTVDAGSQHVTSLDGWRLNADGIVNQQRATIDTVTFPPVDVTVWEYPSVPLTVTGPLTLVADFSDYVREPFVNATDGGGVTYTLLPHGHKADLLITGAGTVTYLGVKGHLINRSPSVTVQAPPASDEPTISQDAYDVRAGSDLSGTLVGAEASAHGIVNHIVWRFAEPLKRPAMTQAVDAAAIPDVFAWDLYDLVAVTVGQLNVSAVLFEIVGVSGKIVMATDVTFYAEVTWLLAEARLLDDPLFTWGTSIWGGGDVWAA